MFWSLGGVIQLCLCRGAALPKNTPAVPCIFDPQGRAGICGDWLLGSNLESAAISGEALGNHVRRLLFLTKLCSLYPNLQNWSSCFLLQIADYLQNSEANPEEFAIGLHDRPSPLAGHHIGQFPGLTSVGEKHEAEAYQLLWVRQATMIKRFKKQEHIDAY